MISRRVAWIDRGRMAAGYGRRAVDIGGRLGAAARGRVDQRHAGQRHGDYQKQHNDSCHTVSFGGTSVGVKPMARRSGPDWPRPVKTTRRVNNYSLSGGESDVYTLKMFNRTRSTSPSHRIAAILMALAILVAGQGVHLPMAQADSDVGAAHMLIGHTPDKAVAKIGDAMMPAEQGPQSTQDCAGTECGSCAATPASSAFGPPSLHDLPSGHAVNDSVVRPPERLFRPPIRLS